MRYRIHVASGKINKQIDVDVDAFDPRLPWAVIETFFARHVPTDFHLVGYEREIEGHPNDHRRD